MLKEGSDVGRNVGTWEQRNAEKPAVVSASSGTSVSREWRSRGPMHISLISSIICATNGSVKVVVERAKGPWTLWTSVQKKALVPLHLLMAQHSLSTRVLCSGLSRYPWCEDVVSVDAATRVSLCFTITAQPY